MNRIDELQKRYPGIPRHVIARHDVLVQGVRLSEDLDKVSQWRAAGWLYQTNDYDVISLKDMAEKTPERVRPGQILRPPGSIRFKTGLGAGLRARSTSPYTIKEVSEGKFALFEGEERVEDVYFFRQKPRTTPEPVTSKGTPISTLIDFMPRCSCIAPMRYCEYFSTGDQCKFCNLNPGHEDARAAGLDDPVRINLEETVEAYKIRSSEVRQLEVSIVMGGLLNSEREAKIFLDFVEKIASATSYKPSITFRTQAMERKDLQRLGDAGFDSMSIQVEVLDPELFPELVPGKSKHAPYEHWIEAFNNAVDVFGAGSVGGKLVPGITLFAPNGHKTWQEARDYHVEADNWLIRNGVVPCFYPLWWAPGSILSQDRSNMDKFPPTEYHLDLALAHHKAMMEQGLYEKMNKFMYCGLDCTTAGYAGDIGMIELAGDVGKWMSDVVPDEDNWLAKFIAEMK